MCRFDFLFPLLILRILQIYRAKSKEIFAEKCFKQDSDILIQPQPLVVQEVRVFGGG